MSQDEFPGLGQRWHADYGQVAFHVDFAADGQSLRWAPADSADFDAAATTETYSATQIRPGVFWVTWREADGTTVSHAEDFERGTVLAAITMPDHQFLTLTGRWTRL
ncbi:MAG: hypothetical protein Q4615_20175 [Paracoccus aminovorans]|nr:hypothetical protein [Paracoccus aminovorans]